MDKVIISDCHLLDLQIKVERNKYIEQHHDTGLNFSTSFCVCSKNVLNLKVGDESCKCLLLRTFIYCELAKTFKFKTNIVSNLSG